MPPAQALENVVFPTFRLASRDILAVFSDSQSFTNSSSGQHSGRIFRHLPNPFPFDALIEVDPLVLTGSYLVA